MTYLIIYSDRAIETFDAITEQINERWGEKYAIDFQQRTLKTLENIRNAPFIFKAIENNPNVRKGGIHRNCSVYYEIKTFQIEILFFWDNRQDPIFL
jgi:plasmid stabilization system protein ParE